MRCKISTKRIFVKLFTEIELDQSSLVTVIRTMFHAIFLSPLSLWRTLIAERMHTWSRHYTVTLIGCNAKGEDTMSIGFEKRSTLRTFYNELRSRADALDHPIVICAAIKNGQHRMVSRGKHHIGLSIPFVTWPFSFSLFLFSSLIWCNCQVKILIHRS